MINRMDDFIDEDEDVVVQEGSCWKWKNHSRNLINSLTTALLEGSFSDVSLVSAEGRSIKAHKIILSAGSPYFQKVFETENNPCTHPIIIILKDVKYADLQVIVEYIYTGRINVEADRIDEIKQAAASLQIKGFEKFKTHIEESRSRWTNIEERSDDRSISSEECLSPILIPRTPSPPLSSATTAPLNSWATSDDCPEAIHNVPRIESGDVTMSISAEFPRGPDFLQENNHATSPTASMSDLSLEEPSDSTLSGKPKGEGVPSEPFIITRQKKKEAWFDPDAVSNRRSSSNPNQTKKRYKQISLMSSYLNMPKPKMDLSKHKNFLGGARSSQSCSTENHQEINKKKTKAGTKRKSDESVEDDGETRCPDLSATFFEIPSPTISPLNNCIHSTPPTSPVQGTSKSVKTNSLKPRSPLSPGRMNIIEPVFEIPKNTKQKRSIFRNDPHDSTLALLRDFDKIPGFKSPSPKKVNHSQGKAKLDRRDLKCICGETTDLALHVDRKELKRNCPKHGSEVEEQPLLRPVDTPENFWCTKQYTTQELYAEGLINVGTPFTPPARRRRRRNSNETYIDTENVTEFYDE